MSTPGTHEARRVFENFRHLVVSMVDDQGQFDAPFVRMWVALGEALDAADGLYKWGEGMRALNTLPADREDE